MSEPLAERMRPRSLADYVGQKHLVGEGAVLRKMIDAGRISSFILWGPPGVGKTTLAQIVAQTLKVPFYPFCRYQWRKGCARGDRESEEWQILQFCFSYLVY